jgi:hypothetical protein
MKKKPLDPKDAAVKAKRQELRREFGEQFTRAPYYIPIEAPAPGSDLRANIATISGSRHTRRGVEGEISQFVDRGNNDRVIERRTSWSEDGTKIDLWFLLSDSPSAVEPGQQIEERYTMSTKKATAKKPAATTAKKEKVAKEPKGREMDLGGLAITSLLRWMGYKGWTNDQIRGCLGQLVKKNKLKRLPADGTLSIQINRGRREPDTAPSVPNDLAAMLREARDSAPPVEPKPAKEKPAKKAVAKAKAPAAKTAKHSGPPPPKQDIVALAKKLDKKSE